MSCHGQIQLHNEVCTLKNTASPSTLLKKKQKEELGDHVCTAWKQDSAKTEDE